jgi:hypothetical protein
MVLQAVSADEPMVIAVSSSRIFANMISPSG